MNFRKNQIFLEFKWFIQIIWLQSIITCIGKARLATVNHGKRRFHRYICYSALLHLRKYNFSNAILGEVNLTFVLVLLQDIFIPGHGAPMLQFLDWTTPSWLHVATPVLRVSSEERTASSLRPKNPKSFGVNIFCDVPRKWVIISCDLPKGM